MIERYTLQCICLLSIVRQAISVTVTLTPESIEVEVGTDSVNFTCTIQLTNAEAAIKHWIVWEMNNTRLFDNDNLHVGINPSKYSVYGMSSVNSAHYTQMIQIHNINNTDEGMYSCTLVFKMMSSYPSFAKLSTKNPICQPSCTRDTGLSHTGATIQLLKCLCATTDTTTMLNWHDSEGPLLQSPPLIIDGWIILDYYIEDVTNNQLLTCTATGSSDSKACVISSDMIQTTVTDIGKEITLTLGYTFSSGSSESSTVPSSTHESVTLNSPESTIASDAITITNSTTHNNITTKSSNKQLTTFPLKEDQTYAVTSINEKSSDRDNNYIVVVFLAILGGIFVVVLILMVVVLMRHKNKKKNKEIRLKKGPVEEWFENPTPSSSNDISEEFNVSDNDQRHINIDFNNDDELQSSYKNAALITDVDDPFYASVELKVVQKNERHSGTGNQIIGNISQQTTDMNEFDPSYATVDKKDSTYTVVDDNKTINTKNLYKSNQFYTAANKKQIFNAEKHQKISSEDDSEYMSTTDMEFKRISHTPVIETPCSTAVNKKQILNTKKTQKISSKDQLEYMSTADMEFKSISHTPVIETPPSIVKHYQANNGGMYAQVNKLSNSISSRIDTLLKDEEIESEQRKPAHKTNGTLRKYPIILDGIDNDDMYSTVSDVTLTKPKDKDEIAKDKTDANVGECEGHGISRAESIHYEVENDTVYTKVLKPQM